MSSNVPNVELELIVGQVLDVEALGGCDGADVLSMRDEVLRLIRL